MSTAHNATQFYNGTHAEGETNNNYRSYYVPTPRTDLMHSFDQMPTLAAAQKTNSNSLSHFRNNFCLEQQPSSNFELMAELAVDLVNVSTPIVNYVANECDYLKDYKEHQERTPLYSSMSPLLAAVNDITKRDAELQLYLNQSFEKHHELISSSNVKTPLDNDEADTIITIITDKSVPCRAKASLPTRFLRLGERNDMTNELIVIAKKSIIHPTKFGPVEGVVRYVSTIDLDVLHIQVPRFYPLLLIDESHTLDVSNEDSSNWMRYIRLAESSAIENLHIFLENGNIFYKTTRTIRAHEELRVSYSADYGARFLLPILSTMGMEKTDHDNISRLRLRLTNLEENRTPRTTKLKRKHKARKNFTTSRCKQQLKAKISKDLMQQLKKLIYKCDMCSKKFSDLPKMVKHKLKHIEEPARKHSCHICQQKCATPTALESHIKGHTHRGFICIYCENKFGDVRSFSKHAATHRTDEGKFRCMHCEKFYASYALVRKHVRLSHNVGRNFPCGECNKKFVCSSELKRHKETHGNEKPHACTQCLRTFLRRDQLMVHQRQVHGIETRKATTQSKKIENAENIIEKLSYKNDLTPEKKENLLEKQLGEEDGNLDVCDEDIKCNDLVKINSNKIDKNVPNIFSASSSNRRKQTPTKLKTLDQKFYTLDYVPLSELLTPYLMSEQELHEEFEKAEMEAALTSTTNKQLHTCKQVDTQVKLNLDKKIGNSMDMKVINTAEKFNCHLCPNAKFKRRGILVNHMTKMHPTIDLDNIELLNTPIIKQQLVYTCFYCKNVYKSAAKRKIHVLKHHPACDIPFCKDKSNPLHVQTVGNREEEIHKCEFCARQYAARSRLLAHYRKMHVDAELPPKTLHKTDSPLIYEEPLLISELNMMTSFTPTTSQENKLLKLSSAALELSRYDFLNERSTDEYQRLPALFDETPLVGIDGLMERYNHRSIEVQFFEKIGKL